MAHAMKPKNGPADRYLGDHRATCESSERGTRKQSECGLCGDVARGRSPSKPFRSRGKVIRGDLVVHVLCPNSHVHPIVHLLHLLVQLAVEDPHKMKMGVAGKKQAAFTYDTSNLRWGNLSREGQGVGQRVHQVVYVCARNDKSNSERNNCESIGHQEHVCP